ncbi:hypothetical protein SmJEL517_g06019 [Synchytrium microbalum]|uniref:FCP1 homology domain-containing protein n=1 Tax=Synchytrium microbalum TaxID=1806994 RepID=A0A507BXF6_9FUNG|nr:uncharacterized protein SmJEL517_g06019 [Synchytrium microbalum]TPX30406.1 hypothetical protein SmJEL517_g06019 [Synchytrium microbalum]
MPSQTLASTQPASFSSSNIKFYLEYVLFLYTYLIAMLTWKGPKRRPSSRLNGTPTPSSSSTSSPKALRRSKRLKSASTDESDSAASDSSISRMSSSSNGHTPRIRKSLRSSVTPDRRIKTLVLDLDETLIHSTSRGSRNHDHMIEVLVDKHVCLYYVYKRPHVDLFLQRVSQWYHLVIFTASMPEYADPVIDYLDKSRTLISRRFFRSACTQNNGIYLKPLHVIEPDLSQVCLLDNSPMSYADHPDNAIPIESWINDPHDEALLDLLPFLDALRFTDDVRTVLSLRV